MEIIKDLRPVAKKYKFIHYSCCEFIANSNEFKWTTGQGNETTARVVCPQCGETFYYDPKVITISSFDDWPRVTNCPKNCKICNAKCLYRKEEYNGYVSPKD